MLTDAGNSDKMCQSFIHFQGGMINASSPPPQNQGGGYIPSIPPRIDAHGCRFSSNWYWGGYQIDIPIGGTHVLRMVVLGLYNPKSRIKLV